MTTRSEIENFERLLREKVRTWSDFAEELGAHPGLRVVKFSSDLVRAEMLEGRVAQWLGHLFAQLPADAAVMDDTGRLVHLCFEPGVYYDRMAIVVASREWEAVPEGALIPEFIPTFERKVAA